MTLFYLVLWREFDLEPGMIPFLRGLQLGGLGKAQVESLLLCYYTRKRKRSLGFAQASPLPCGEENWAL